MILQDTDGRGSCPVQRGCTRARSVDTRNQTSQHWYHHRDGYRRTETSWTKLIKGVTIQLFFVENSHRLHDAFVDDDIYLIVKVIYCGIKRLLRNEGKMYRITTALVQKNSTSSDDQERISNAAGKGNFTGCRGRRNMGCVGINARRGVIRTCAFS